MAFVPLMKKKSKKVPSPRKTRWRLGKERVNGQGPGRVRDRASKWGKKKRKRRKKERLQVFLRLGEEKIIEKIDKGEQWRRHLG